MNRLARLSVLLGAVLTVSAGPPLAAPGPVDLGVTQPGMGMARVRELLGEPERVARQLLFRRHLEQWVYPGDGGGRVEFDCVRGEEPRVIAVLRPR
jgi:hypothetical protein